ncbi:MULTISPECIES: aminotransferase class IV [Nonomuraea]|uniref:Aminotransferase class IV n=2 Tax=Nonomuraea harbinensis TaxID=1286938 RepID=A0ABW1C773_9ACTN|nr:aminotransferase class IV [Nonomuraea sp. C10]
MGAVIDGRAAEAGDVALAMSARYGHFTAMQVRGGKVRGPAAHLDRLSGATRELFGQELDLDLVRASVRALEAVDASVRVFVCDAGGVRVIAVSGPPVRLAATPKRLRSVRYQRFLPHIKHTGGFPQGYLGRLAEREGYDEALLTSDDGVISEGAVTNLGCFDGDRVIWPDAPMLRGVTMRLLEGELARAGVPCERRVLRVADLTEFPAVFLANSWGVVAVDRVDGHRIEVDEALMARVTGCYESAGWDSF